MIIKILDQSLVCDLSGCSVSMICGEYDRVSDRISSSCMEGCKQLDVQNLSGKNFWPDQARDLGIWLGKMSTSSANSMSTTHQHINASKLDSVVTNSHQLNR